MRIVAVDLDGTLTDRAYIFGHWAAVFFEEHGIQDGDAVGWLTRLDNDGRADKHDLFRAAAERWELEAPADQLVEAFYDQFVHLHDVTDEVRDALDSLREVGLTVVIVTNGSPRQVDKIRAARLDKHVDATTVSSLVGARKPDPAIYRAAADSVGGFIDEIEWVIGDSPSEDIAGAHNIGAHSVWIRRGRRWPHQHDPPNAIADSIAQAVEVVLEHAQPTPRHPRR